MPVLKLKSEHKTSSGLVGQFDNGMRLQVDFAAEFLVRVALFPKDGMETDRTWMVAPDGELPPEGRSRLSLDGFQMPLVEHDGSRFGTETLRISFSAEPFQLTAEQKVEGCWRTCLRDRELGAYVNFPVRREIKHFQARSEHDRHYGLGDKAGPVDRTRRRFKCLQTDALGYDAELSDPLYKHAPFTLVDHPKNGVSGVLYDTMSEIEFDYGCEHSNYFESFRHVTVREDCLVYWVIAGPRLSDVVPRLMGLTGGQAMPPRSALGFGFSAMGHTDHENAQETILEFAHYCRSHDIPLSAIHLGSGYSLHGKHRHVFEWNKQRFPNRDDFFSGMKKMGFHLCANIKPVLLENHPYYNEGREQGWFVRTQEGNPVVERFWDGWGSQLDFTNPDTRNWWKGKVQANLLEPGVDGIWNDNNEAELWDEHARLHGCGMPLRAMDARPVHALLMVQSSYHAAQETNPDVRPHMITRSGPIGIARYGETWTGDNQTSWHSLKWNLRQGLSMSLSGFPLTGHDIGGFSGPAPGPELLVRWFQMMALHPRAVMNSWKPDTKHGANLPFMYPEVLSEIKSALHYRYRFLPHIYHLLWKCHSVGHPIIMPTFYEFDDLECLEDNDCFLLGPDLLVAPVVNPDAELLSVYLPRSKDHWIEFEKSKTYNGGQFHSLPVSLGSLPIFVRCGAILVLASAWDQNNPHDATAFEIHIFPGPTDGKTEAEFYWDDGTSVIEERVANPSPLTMTWDRERVSLSCRNHTALPMKVICHSLGSRELVETISE